MSKLTAIINLVAGCVFTICGGFVVYRTGAFLCNAPRDHQELVAAAFVINVVGICVTICGLAYIFQAANRLQGNEVPEDFQ